MTLTNLTYDKLDRHHEQAKQARFDAVLRNDEDAYRAADSLETKTRREKIRRAIARRDGQ